MLHLCSTLCNISFLLSILFILFIFYQFSQKTRLVQEGKPIGVQPENLFELQILLVYEHFLVPLQYEIKFLVQ